MRSACWAPLSRLRLPKIRASPLEPRLRHSGDVEQLVERREAPLSFAQLDDPGRNRAPDPGNRGELCRVGPVDVDSTGRRRMRRAAAPVPLARTRTCRFAGHRDVNLVAVIRALREIDGPRVGRGAQPTRDRDGLCVAVAGAQMVEAWAFD